MKNKYMIFMLTAALFTGSLTGCQARSDQSSTQESAPDDDSDNTASSRDNDSSEVPGAEQDTVVSDNDDLSKDDAQDSSDTEVSMTEQILLEQEGVTVKAVSWDSDTASLKIQAQNTSDQDYIIQLSGTSINNYMMDPIFSLNVNANSQAEKNAEFDLTALSDCGIEKAAQIETKVNILDAISFDVQYTSEYITVQTGAPLENQTSEETGEVLYDQDGLKLISKGFVDDPDWGKLWKVYISNDTEEDLVIHTPTVTLNGNTLDVLFSVTVPAGKKAISSMTIFQEDLDTYQIDNVSSAAMTLQLQNPETFETLRTIDDISLNISAE